MPKYLSGRVKRSANSELKSDRYTYLSLEQAEPNPSDPVTLGISDGASSVGFPDGTKYQVFSVHGDPNPGARYWQPVGGGIIPGSISVYDEGTVIGGANSITQLNFVGAAVTAESTPPGTGVAATITVAPPGHSGEVIFGLKVGSGITDFSSSNNLVFDPNVGIFTSKNIHIGNSIGLGGSIFSAFSGTSAGVGVASVGIGTSDPTATIHVKGDIRLEGTLYDGDNEPGIAGDLLVKATNSLEWKAPNTVQSGAGGYVSNVQYHDDTGLVDGAPNFVWVEPTTVGMAGSVGIGSTQPRVLFEVLGESIFTGLTTFTGGDVEFIGVNAGVTSAYWDQDTNSFQFIDDTKAKFGTGGDLEIYYTEGDGSNGGSVFKHTGDHDMRFQVPSGNHDIVFERSSDGANLAVYNADGAVDLHWRGTGNPGKKFETTQTGAIVTGILTGSQTLNSPELYINPTGVGTIGNVKISGNVVTTAVGALTIRSNSGTVTTPDKFTVTNTTDSTNADSGALQVDGGVGINKNIHAGGSLVVSGYTAEAPVTYPYKFDNTDTNPGSGELYFNQAEGLADTLSIHENDSNGTNRGNLVLKYIRLGDKITITRTSDSSNTVTFKVTGDAAGAAGATYNIPISYLEGDWTPVSNLTPVNITIHQRGEGSVTLASAGGITTTGGDLYIGGDLFVQDDIFLDEANFRQLQVAGVSTFQGDIHIGVGNTAAFFNVLETKVGIGTSVPSQELHLFNQHGDVTLKLESYESNKDTQIELFHRDLRKWSLINDSSNTHQLEIQGDGGASDKFLIIKQDGMIGIGEENPSYLLDIKGATGSDAVLQLRNDGVETSDNTIIQNKIDGVAASNYIFFGDLNDDDIGMIVYDHSDDSLKFTANTIEALTIESTGIVTSKGQTLFAKEFGVLGVSTFVGITTVRDTLFSKELGVLGFSTFVGITTVNDTLFSNEFGVLGFSTFVGITTVNDTLFSNELSVLGFSTFHDTVELKGGLKDKDGELGSNGQLLESRDSKTNWVSPSDLTIENANRVGVGTTDADDTTVSYYPTFVNSNNNDPDSRLNEYLYSDIGLSYSLSYNDGVGIGSVGIGTSNPDTILHVEEDYGSAIFKLEGHSDGDAIVNLRAQGTGIGKIAAWDQLAIGKADATNDIASDGEWMRITSAGLVGIGKDSNLLYQLELQRNSADLLRINNSGETGHGSHDANIIAGGTYYQNPVIGGSTIKFKTFNGSTFDERVTIDPIGNFIVSAATGISTFVGGAHVTGVGVSIAAGGLDVNPLGISTLHNLETRFINDINHYLEIGDFGQILYNNTDANPLELWSPLVIEGSYIPEHGEIIKIEFSQDEKPTRQLIYRYNATKTDDPGNGEITSYYGVPYNVSTNFNTSNAKLIFNKTALPGSYNTVLFTNDGSNSGALDGYSFGHASFRITFSAHVDISRRVGIGTSVPSDDQSTNRGAFLAVAGIVTATDYYGTFKGTIDPDVPVENANNIKITDEAPTRHVDPSVDAGTHYLHFGSATSGYDGVEVDSEYLVYKNNKLGIGTDEPRARLHIYGGNGLVDYDEARFRITKHAAPADEKHWELSANLDGHLRIQGIDDSSDNAGHGAGGGDHFDFWRDGKQIKEFRAVGAGNTWFTIFNDTQAHGDRDDLRGVGIGTTAPYEVVHSDNMVTLNVGVVTANEYWGTFKGDIDPLTAITNAKHIEVTEKNDGVDYQITFTPVASATGYQDIYIDENDSHLTYNPLLGKLSTGALILSSDLDVSGISTLTKDVYAEGNLKLTGIATVGGGMVVTGYGVSIKGDDAHLSVGGIATVGERLVVTGYGVSIHGGLDDSNNIIGGDLSVVGVSTFVGLSTFFKVGIGTNLPYNKIVSSEVKYTENAWTPDHQLSVAGVITSHVLYANEIRGGTFYGSIDPNVATSKADTVKITDDTNPTGTHYIHFGDQKGDSGNEYDGVEVDSTGLVYKDGNVGINQINPNKAKLHVVADTGSAEKIVAKFRNPESVADNKAKIGLVAGYSDTANDLEAHAYVGAQREGSGNNSALFFETSNGSTVTENLRITSDGNVGIDETDPTKVTSTNTKSLAVGIVTANQVWGSINRVELLKKSDSESGVDVGTVVILDTMPRADVDVLEYTFYFKIGDDIQSQKLLVMNDDHGTEDNVYSNEYAMMYNEKQLVDVQGFIQSSALSIKATSLVAGTLEYTWVRNLIKHQLDWPA